MGWDFMEIKTIDGNVIRTVASCRHDDAISVESVVDGAVVAHLCRDCDRQFPAEWSA